MLPESKVTAGEFLNLNPTSGATLLNKLAEPTREDLRTKRRDAERPEEEELAEVQKEEVAQPRAKNPFVIDKAPRVPQSLKVINQ